MSHFYFKYCASHLAVHSIDLKLEVLPEMFKHATPFVG